MPRRFRRLRRISQRTIVVTRQFINRWYCSCTFPDILDIDVQTIPTVDTTNESEDTPIEQLMAQFVPSRVGPTQRSVGPAALRPEALSIHSDYTTLSSGLPSLQEGTVRISTDTGCLDETEIDVESSQSDGYSTEHRDSSDEDVSDASASISVAHPGSENGLPHFAVLRAVRVEYAISTAWSQPKPHHWEIVRPLSWAGFGILNLARVGDSRKFVVKTVKATERPRDIEILRECQSEFTVKLYASFANRTNRFVCMKYCRQGDLGRYIQSDNSKECFTESVAALIASYLYAAVRFLHSKEVLHLDIRPRNILITNHGYPVLTGFDNACRFGEDHPDPQRIAINYASPEILGNNPPTHLSDLWSIACVLYEMLVGAAPFYSSDFAETALRITLGIAPDVSTLSTETGNFLTSELNVLAEQRAGFRGGIAAIMKREMFRNVDWRIVRKGERLEKCPLNPLWERIRTGIPCEDIEDIEDDGEVSDDNIEATVTEDKPEKFDINWRKWLGKS